MAEGGHSVRKVLSLFCTTVALILQDDGFSLPSEPAGNALSLAEKYLELFNDIIIYTCTCTYMYVCIHKNYFFAQGGCLYVL